MAEIHPLTPDRWSDFEALMGPKGGAEGCWCMLWRQSAKAFRENQGAGNKSAMHAIIAQGGVSGLLAYEDGAAVGWISIAPRAQFPRMNASKVLAPVDHRAVWSITCFFITKTARRSGLASKMIEAACHFAKTRGAQMIEGYPIAPDPTKRFSPSFAWTGFKASFDRAGFKEVARRSPTRPIMRRAL